MSILIEISENLQKGKAKIVKHVSKKMFTPPPKVDSCIVHFEFGEAKYDKEFAQFIRFWFQKWS